VSAIVSAFKKLTGEKIHAGKISSHERRWGLLFALPAMVFFSIFLIYPTINAFYLSLFKYDILTKPIFIGFQNYIGLFSETGFWNSFGVTCIYVFGTAFPIMIISLIAALVLNQSVAGRGFYRTVFYLPSVMSLVAVAIIFSGVFNAYGVINYFLSFFIKWDKPIYWLAEIPYALIAIITVRVWRAFGYYMVIYLAGLQNIPQDYYDAATIDGVGWWSRFRYITWPLLAPTTVIVGLISVVNAFQAFTVPYVMTKGGPAEATRILPIMLYQVGFQYFKMGRAATVSVIIFVIIAVFAIIQFRLSRKTY